MQMALDSNNAEVCAATKEHNALCIVTPSECRIIKVKELPSEKYYITPEFLF